VAFICTQRRSFLRRYQGVILAFDFLSLASWLFRPGFFREKHRSRNVTVHWLVEIGSSLNCWVQTKKGHSFVLGLQLVHHFYPRDSILNFYVLSTPFCKRALQLFFSLDLLPKLFANLNPTVEILSGGHHDFNGLAFSDLADLAVDNYASLGPSESVFKVFFEVSSLVLFVNRQRERHRLFLVGGVHKFELVVAAELVCIAGVLRR
jgi:hypothetical protein